jgi:esterase
MYGRHCLWSLCLLATCFHHTHSFSQLSIGRLAAGRSVFHRDATALCSNSATRQVQWCRAQSGGLRATRGTAVTESSATSLTVEAMSSDKDPGRKRTWALKRAEGLKRAAAKGTVPLKYIEIDCPGGHCDLEVEPLVILHGLLGSSRNFQGFAKALSSRLERPRRIIIPDLRNHGDSPHTRSMSYMSMATDVIALLDTLGIDKSCIIGHSMGGKVAAALALYHSERVESVAILDIAPVDYSRQIGPGAETWKDISAIIKALDDVPPEAMTDKKLVDDELAKTIGDPVLRAFALTNLVRDSATGGVRWKIGISNLKRNMGIIGGFDIGQGLQDPASQMGLSFPRDAFFVQGGKSRFISSRYAHNPADLNP